LRGESVVFHGCAHLPLPRPELIEVDGQEKGSVMDDHKTGFRMHNDDVVPWRSRVPPGVPGAGWLLATIVVFAVFIFTGWSQGWWEGNRTIAAAPTASHHTTGSGNKVPQ
jgi:hypothetical protein